MKIWLEFRHWFLLFGFSIWEYWLGKTEKLVASSTYELIWWLLKRPFTKEKLVQEQDIKLGKVGDLDIKLDAGKLSISLLAKVPDAALSAGVSIELEAGLLVDKLEAIVEAKYPAGLPVEKVVFAALKKALVEV